MPYVYSSLTSDQAYTLWEEQTDNNRQLPRMVRQIHVKGGANLSAKNIYVPAKGIATQVTAEELAILEDHSDFKLHKANGFIVVDKRDKLENADNIAKASLKPKDTSAQKTDADFGRDVPVAKTVAASRR